MTHTDHPPLRKLTEAEFATIGRIVLIWGSHEQSVGSIVSAGFKIPQGASVPLVHSLPYSKKVDLACRTLESRKSEVFLELAKELDYIRRVFRPERDTIAHGSFGMWADDAWVRSISKDRFVIFDDLESIRDRAEYARHVSAEAAYKIQDYSSEQVRPPRPSAPSGRTPDGWLSR